MVWVCDQVRKNKYSKSGYVNKRSKEKRKRKNKKEMIGYD
jgi:hypothetical protein